MEIDSWRIINIKLSVKIPKKSLSEWILKCEERGWTYKSCGNFIIIYPTERLRYSVFGGKIDAESQHINISGVANRLEIIIAERLLAQLFGTSIVHWTRIIDCVTFQWKFDSRKIDIRKLYRLARDKRIQARLNFEKFPGLLLRFRIKYKQLATAIIYSSGCAIVFNCRSHRECIVTLHHLKIFLACTLGNF